MLWPLCAQALTLAWPTLTLSAKHSLDCWVPWRAQIPQAHLPALVPHQAVLGKPANKRVRGTEEWRLLKDQSRPPVWPLFVFILTTGSLLAKNGHACCLIKQKCCALAGENFLFNTFCMEKQNSPSLSPSTTLHTVHTESEEMLSVPFVPRLPPTSLSHASV